MNKWERVCKNEPGEICGIQPFKKFHLVYSWILCPKEAMERKRVQVVMFYYFNKTVIFRKDIRHICDNVYKIVRFLN